MSYFVFGVDLLPLLLVEYRKNISNICAIFQIDFRFSCSYNTSTL